jgi:ferrous iron transport protein B
VIVSTLSVVIVGEDVSAPAADAAPTPLWRDLANIGVGFASATWNTVRGTISLIPGVNLLPDDAGAPVDAGLAAALRGAFSPLAAVAFCVYVLLTAPCVTTMAALKSEFGPRWMAFSVGLMLVVAWVAAVAVYQTGLLFGLG